MRLLITGGSGFVGWNLLDQALDRGHDVIYTYHQNRVEHDGATAWGMDIRSENRVQSVVDDADPDAIIHAAAMTDVDGCERDQERARRINVDGTRYVVEAAADVDAEIALISTSFVFDGESNEYREENERNPINRYGETKANAERIVESTDVDSLILRTDQPYGFANPWQGTTMIDWTLERLNGNESFSVFTDWCNNPIYIEDLNHAILTLVEGDHSGRYHIVGPDYVSRYEWALAIADAFDRSSDRIEQGSAAKVGFPATRPNANLANEKINREMGLSFRGIKEGVGCLATDY
jgi:dTDP-4-dehydrorhamnose reductase